MHPDRYALTTSVPPREGNALEVLIDGANALPRMAEAIRDAKRHVHVCSWHLEPAYVEFLAHSLVSRDEDGRPRVEYLPVTITRWPPGERIYGR